MEQERNENFNSVNSKGNYAESSSSGLAATSTSTSCQEFAIPSLPPLPSSLLKSKRSTQMDWSRDDVSQTGSADTPRDRDSHFRSTLFGATPALSPFPSSSPTSNRFSTRTPTHTPAPGPSLSSLAPHTQTHNHTMSTTHTNKDTNKDTNNLQRAGDRWEAELPRLSMSSLSSALPSHNQHQAAQEYNQGQRRDRTPRDPFKLNTLLSPAPLPSPSPTGFVARGERQADWDTIAQRDRDGLDLSARSVRSMRSVRSVRSIRTQDDTADDISEIVNVQMQEQLDKKEAECLQLSMTKSDLEGKLTTLTEQLQNSKSAITAKQHDKQSMNTAYKELTQAYTLKEEELNALSTAYAELSARLTKAQTQTSGKLSNKEGQCLALQTTASELRVQLAAQEDKIERLLASEGKLKLQVSDLTECHQAAQDKLAEKERDLQQVGTSHNDLVKSLATQDDDRLSWITQKGDLSKTISELSAHVKTSEANAATLTRKFEAADEARRALELQLESVRKAGVEAEAQLELKAVEVARLGKVGRDLEVRLQRAEQELAVEKEQLRTTKDELASAVHAARQTKAQLSSALARKSAECEQLAATNSQTTAQLVDLEDQISGLKQAKVTVDSRLREKGGECQRLSEDLREVRDTVQQLRQKLAQERDMQFNKKLTQAKAELTARLAAAEHQLSSLARSRSEVVAKLADKADECANLSMAKSKLEAQVVGMRGQFDQLKEKEDECLQLRAAYSQLSSQLEIRTLEVKRLGASRQTLLTTLGRKDEAVAMLTKSNSELQEATQESRELARQKYEDYEKLAASSARDTPAPPSVVGGTRRASLSEDYEERRRWEERVEQMREEMEREMRGELMNVRDGMEEEMRKQCARANGLTEQARMRCQELEQKLAQGFDNTEQQEQVAALLRAKAESEALLEAKEAEVSEKEAKWSKELARLREIEDGLEARLQQSDASAQETRQQMQRESERAAALAKQAAVDREERERRTDEHQREIAALKEAQRALHGANSTAERLQQKERDLLAQEAALEQREASIQTKQQQEQQAQRRAEEEVVRGKAELTRKIQAYNERVRVLNKATKDLKHKRDELRRMTPTTNRSGYSTDGSTTGSTIA